ncbi:MAG TPA: hypothetical protein VGQ83_10255 [Polyangia bacterium]|jgi:hypothetical protein
MPRLESLPLPRPRTLLVVLGGPALVGACLGLPFGLRALATEAALVPAIVLGLAALMIPALYIGSSLLGIAPPAASVALAVGHALRVMGVALCGLTPPAAFLLATSCTPTVARLLAALVLGGAAICALRLLYHSMFVSRGTHLKVLPLFTAWAFVTGAIGARLLLGTLPQGVTP